ncbi:CatB-related O-acetyltransferase [Martelella soudanensis]|uniref:CatB-related O-acetyltransferase n=1 Tax=unclassified Martelella TaxID=2629616 RepID=UPI0015DFDAE1|nr:MULTISPECIES: CatB-related O-acetyltransferase [unclassified Martelella]
MNIKSQIAGPLKTSARFVLWQIRNYRHHHTVESAHVSPRAKIGYRAIVRRGTEVGWDVELGDYSYISGPRSYVEAARIGRFCSIARQTVIGASNHDYTRVSSHPFALSPAYGNLCTHPKAVEQKPAPVIGNDVWIAANSAVMRGVTIGDGAVVAANSVVTRDVPPYSIVGGSPARVLKPRFSPEIAEAMLRIAWWNWDETTLRDRIETFDDPEQFVKDFG